MSANQPSNKTTTEAPPANWQRRLCPYCDRWVTGIVRKGQPVADHDCPHVAAMAWAKRFGEDVNYDD